MINLPDNFYYLKICYFGEGDLDKSSEITIWNNPHIENNVRVATRHSFLHERSIKADFDTIDEALQHAKKFIKGDNMSESSVWIIARRYMQNDLPKWEIVEILEYRSKTIERCKELLNFGEKTLYVFKLVTMVQVADPPIEIIEFS